MVARFPVSRAPRWITDEPKCHGLFLDAHVEGVPHVLWAARCILVGITNADSSDLLEPDFEDCKRIFLQARLSNVAGCMGSAGEAAPQRNLCTEKSSIPRYR